MTPVAQAFATTHWSVVIAAGDSAPGAEQALQSLCQAYWYPIYAYVRRRGHSVEDAQDLTQEFFVRLLRQKSVSRADPERGRFRTFLLTSLKHFLINEWTKANRQKRGGGCQFIYLDADETESRFQREPADERSPDKAFDRQWAKVLLALVLTQLERDYESSDQGRLFSELIFFLTGDSGADSYQQLRQRLGLSESNLKVTVHRMRRRYRDLLEAEIRRTVADSDAIADEMRSLLDALRC